LAQNFPILKETPTWGMEYARDMNFGEFVHFWSGAAQVNLQPLAENAFGWTDQYQKEFTKAQNDFPSIKYVDVGFIDEKSVC